MLLGRWRWRCCGPPRPGQQQQCDPNLYLHCRWCSGVETTIFGSSRHHLGIYQHHGAATSAWALGSQDTSHLLWHSWHSWHASHIPHTRKHLVTRSQEPPREPCQKSSISTFYTSQHLKTVLNKGLLHLTTNYWQQHIAITDSLPSPSPPSPAQLNNVHIKAGLAPPQPPAEVLSCLLIDGGAAAALPSFCCSAL